MAPIPSLDRFEVRHSGLGMFMKLAALVIAAATPMLGSCAMQQAPGTIAGIGNPQSAADALLEVDRDFAAAAANRPASDAIAAMLDDDAVLFIQPLGTLARGRAAALEVLDEAFTGDPSTLNWAPVRAGISADGTQGFTYGFATRTIAGKPPTLGKYLSYWIKRPAGWRLAAFKLVPRPQGAVATDLRPAAVPERIVPVELQAAVVERYRAELDRTERDFSDFSQATDLGTAFRKYGSADAMNMGGDADFTYGNEAIAAGFGPGKGSPLHWAPDGVLVASSGDLGITYGYLERNQPAPPGRLARIPWFTVWHRAKPQAPWRYIAE